MKFIVSSVLVLAVAVSAAPTSAISASSPALNNPIIGDVSSQLSSTGISATAVAISSSSNIPTTAGATGSGVPTTAEGNNNAQYLSAALESTYDFKFNLELLASGQFCLSQAQFPNWYQQQASNEFELYAQFVNSQSTGTTTNVQTLVAQFQKTTQTTSFPSPQGELSKRTNTIDYNNDCDPVEIVQLACAALFWRQNNVYNLVNEILAEILAVEILFLAIDAEEFCSFNPQTNAYSFQPTGLFGDAEQASQTSSAFSVAVSQSSSTTNTGNF